MQTRRILILGQSGTGKTSFARRLVSPNEHRAEWPTRRILGLDPVPDNDGGWATVCSLVETWDEFKAEARKPYFRIVDQTEIGHYAEGHDQLDLAIRIARAREVSNCIFFVDELSPYFKKGNEAPESIQRLVRFGRRQGVHSLLISQRAVDCPIEVRSQLTDLFCFRLIESDVEHLSRFIGRRNAEKVVALPFFHFLHFNLTEPLPKTGKDQDDLEARTLGDGDRSGHLLGGSPRELHPQQRDEGPDDVARDEDEGDE